ncbi:MAG: hypothetical protein ABSG53_13970 [Thermoguttaceae bacterium]
MARSNNAATQPANSPTYTSLLRLRMRPKFNAAAVVVPNSRRNMGRFSPSASTTIQETTPVNNSASSGR